MLELGLFLLLSLCTKADEIRTFQQQLHMTLFAVYKWVRTFGYVDRESCVKEAWKGNERGRRDKKHGMRTKQRIGNEATDRAGVKVVLIFHFPVPIFNFSVLCARCKRPVFSWQHPSLWKFKNMKRYDNACALQP